MDALLKELGNTATAIPYYAIFSPGLSEPIHFGGNVITASQVAAEVQKGLDAAGKTVGQQTEQMASSKAIEQSEY